MTEPTKEQMEAAKKFLAERYPGSDHEDEDCLAAFVAARDAEKDAALALKESELRWLRGIIGDAHSKSTLRREVAQGRVEAWVKEHDAEVLRPWREALELARSLVCDWTCPRSWVGIKERPHTKHCSSFAALLSPAPKDAPGGKT